MPSPEDLLLQAAGRLTREEWAAGVKTSDLANLLDGGRMRYLDEMPDDYMVKFRNADGEIFYRRNVPTGPPVNSLMKQLFTPGYYLHYNYDGNGFYPATVVRIGERPYVQHMASGFTTRLADMSGLFYGPLPIPGGRP